MTFEESYGLADSISGWLTQDQARELYRAARSIPHGGTVIEIGSHHGRSAVVLAMALPDDGRLVAVDPFPEDWRYGAAGTEAVCRANLRRAGVSERVDLRTSTSREVRQGWTAKVDLVYIDGKHDLWSVRDDLSWSSLVQPGGSVFVHDAFSSLGVTLGLVSTLASSSTLTYIGRTGSLAHLKVAKPTPADRLRPLREVPWFARNLVVKVLLRMQLRPVAARLGHHDSADPY